MTLTTLIMHLLLTIPLTLIINNISKKEKNTLNKIIIPTVYIIIAAALIPAVKNNVFLIVVFELFIRNFYISNFSNKTNNIASFLLESVLSVALSLFAYNNFIAKVSTVLPSPEAIKPFLWFLIIIYIYNLLKPQINNINKMIPEKKDIDKENTIMLFAKYKNKYHKVIKTKNKLITNIIYSIMIFNGMNKPLLLRKAIEIKGMLTTQEIPYGIMQYTSKEKLTDEESITKTLKEFEDINKLKISEKEKINKMLSKYDESSKNQIKEIYDEIIEFLKK